MEVEKQFNRKNLMFNYEDISFEKNGMITICKIKGHFSSIFPMVNVVEKVLKKHGYKPTHCFLSANKPCTVACTTFQATVKCSENDEYDEIVGQRIAESKCKSKIILTTITMIGELAELCEMELKNLLNLGAKNFEYLAQERKHIDELDEANNYKGVTDRILTTDNETIPTTPVNGTDYQLDELHSIVNGHIDVLVSQDGKEMMVLNEEGKVLGLPINKEATRWYVKNFGATDYIVGNVLICKRTHVK